MQKFKAVKYLRLSYSEDHDVESDSISKKVKSAKQAKIKRGEYQHKICCYGYQKGENNRLEIDKEAAKVIKIIYKLKLKDKSTRESLKELYDRKIPTPGQYKASIGEDYYRIEKCNDMWEPTAIRRTLSDERYIGTYIAAKWRVREVGSNRKILKDEKDWIRLENHHPAIIDKDTFYKVQEKLKNNDRKKKKIDRQYLLKSKIICGCCNHAMNRSRAKDAVFYCRFTQPYNTYPCHGLDVNEKALEKILFDIISKQMFD